MKPPVVLVVRSDDVFSRRLRDAGFEVLNLELIRTAEADDLTDLHKILARIDDYDGLFFTSPVAATVFTEQMKLAGHAFGGKVYVLGERAKIIMANAGFNVVCPDQANTAADLIASFDDAEFAGKRLLFVRGDKSLRIIPDLLNGRAQIDEIVVYETKEIQPDGEIVGTIRRRLKRGEIDWICFFSSSGVQSFGKFFVDEIWSNIKIAAIGETTACEARESNLQVDFVSQRATTEDFAAGLIENIKNSE